MRTGPYRISVLSSIDAWNTATSRAGLPSPASGTCAGDGRSTRTWAASIGVRSAMSGPSSGWPIGHRMPATGGRSGSRRTSSRSSAGRSHVGRGRNRSSSATRPTRTSRPSTIAARGAIREALADARTPIGIITRGPMVDPRRRRPGSAATRAEVGVAFSIPTLDLEVWRRTEPGTAPPANASVRSGRSSMPASRRASACPRSARPVGRSAKMADVVQAARDMRATSVWTNVLFLRPGTREHFLEHLAATGQAPADVRAAVRRGATSRRRTSWSPSGRRSWLARARHRRPTNTADPPDPGGRSGRRALSLRLEPRAA